jgi:hypothetical protein
LSHFPSLSIASPSPKDRILGDKLLFKIDSEFTTTWICTLESQDSPPQNFRTVGKNQVGLSFSLHDGITGGSLKRSIGQEKYRSTVLVDLFMIIASSLTPISNAD